MSTCRSLITPVFLSRRSVLAFGPVVIVIAVFVRTSPKSKEVRYAFKNQQGGALEWKEKQTSLSLPRQLKSHSTTLKPMSKSRFESKSLTFEKRSEYISLGIFFLLVYHPQMLVLRPRWRGALASRCNHATIHELQWHHVASAIGNPSINPPIKIYAKHQNLIPLLNRESRSS